MGACDRPIAPAVTMTTRKDTYEQGSRCGRTSLHCAPPSPNRSADGRYTLCDTETRLCSVGSMCHNENGCGTKWKWMKRDPLIKRAPEGDVAAVSVL